MILHTDHRLFIRIIVADRDGPPILIILIRRHRIAGILSRHQLSLQPIVRPCTHFPSVVVFKPLRRTADIRAERGITLYIIVFFSDYSPALIHISGPGYARLSVHRCLQHLVPVSLIVAVCFLSPLIFPVHSRIARIRAVRQLSCLIFVQFPNPIAAVLVLIPDFRHMIIRPACFLISFITFPLIPYINRKELRGDPEKRPIRIFTPVLIISFPDQKISLIVILFRHGISPCRQADRMILLIKILFIYDLIFIFRNARIFYIRVAAQCIKNRTVSIHIQILYRRYIIVLIRDILIFYRRIAAFYTAWLIFLTIIPFICNAPLSVILITYCRIPLPARRQPSVSVTITFFANAPVFIDPVTNNFVITVLIRLLLLMYFRISFTLRTVFFLRRFTVFRRCLSLTILFHISRLEGNLILPACLTQRSCLRLLRHIAFRRHCPVCRIIRLRKSRLCRHI